MIETKDTSLRDFLTELLIIVGGFILAETIVKQFLLLAAGKIPWWVLPLFAINVIIVALNFKNQNINLTKTGILSVVFLGALIFLIVLMKNNVIPNSTFLEIVFILMMSGILISLLLFFYERNKSGE